MMMDNLTCSEDMFDVSPDVSAELEAKHRYEETLPSELISDPKPLTAFVDKNLVEDNRVLLNMLKMEKNPNWTVHDYIKTIQNELTPAMKQDVEFWMFEVCEQEKMTEAVFVRAVQYMDRFLSLQRIVRTQFQLLGSVCLLISSKMAGTPFTILRLVAYTANSVTIEMIRSWEEMVLTVLQWDTCDIVSVDFVYHFLNLLPPEWWNTPAILERIKTFTAFSAGDHKFLPSRKAAASIILGIKPFVKPEYENHVLTKFYAATKIEPSQIRACMDHLNAGVLAGINSQPN